MKDVFFYQEMEEKSIDDKFTTLNKRNTIKTEDEGKNKDQRFYICKEMHKRFTITNKLVNQLWAKLKAPTYLACNLVYSN